MLHKLGFWLRIFPLHHKMLNLQWKNFNIHWGRKDILTKFQMERWFVPWDIRMQMDRQRQYREISDPYDFSPIGFYPGFLLTTNYSLDPILLLFGSSFGWLELKLRKSGPFWGIKYIGESFAWLSKLSVPKFSMVIKVNYSFKNGCRHPLTYLVCS